MTTITRLTVFLASEIKTKRIFNRVVKAYKAAGFPTDEHCTKFHNVFGRHYFGMGNFAIGWLDIDFHESPVVISVADLP